MSLARPVRRTRRAWLVCGKCLTVTPHIFADSTPVRDASGGPVSTELIYECAICGRPRRWGVESDQAAPE